MSLTLLATLLYVPREEPAFIGHGQICNTIDRHKEHYPVRVIEPSADGIGSVTSKTRHQVINDSVLSFVDQFIFIAVLLDEVDPE